MSTGSGQSHGRGLAAAAARAASARLARPGGLQRSTVGRPNSIRLSSRSIWRAPSSGRRRPTSPATDCARTRRLQESWRPSWLVAPELWGRRLRAESLSNLFVVRLPGDFFSRLAGWLAPEQSPASQPPQCARSAPLGMAADANGDLGGRISRRLTGGCEQALRAPFKRDHHQRKWAQIRAQTPPPLLLLPPVDLTRQTPASAAYLACRSCWRRACHAGCQPTGQQLANLQGATPLALCRRSGAPASERRIARQLGANQYGAKQAS